MSHEQIFYGDGTNEGFFKDNMVRPDDPSLLDEYRITRSGYDSKLLKEAVDSTKLQNYKLLGGSLTLR